MPEVLYNSAAIKQKINLLFDAPDKSDRRVALVAYIGRDYADCAGVRSNRTAIMRSVNVVRCVILASIGWRHALPVMILMTRWMFVASSLGKSILAVAARLRISGKWLRAIGDIAMSGRAKHSASTEISSCFSLSDAFGTSSTIRDATSNAVGERLRQRCAIENTSSTGLTGKVGQGDRVP